MTSGSRVTTQTPSRRAARRAAKTSLSIARASSWRSLGPSAGTRRCLALTRSLAGTAQMIILTGAARAGSLRGWPEPGATRLRSASGLSIYRAPRVEDDARQGNLPVTVRHEDVGEHGLDASARQLGDAGDLGFLAPEIRRERERTGGGPDPRGPGLVAHRENARRHAQATAQLGRHRRERSTLAERARPVEMRGEVAVAQVEPRLGAEVAHRLEAAERLAREAPAAGRVEPTRERVHHGVEVGGNVETPDLGVITGVADHGERTPRDRGREAAQELRRARATGDRGQAHVTRAWLPAASRARCRRATRRAPRPPGG